MSARFIGTLVAVMALVLLIAFTGNGDVFDPLVIQDDVAVPAGALAGAATIGQTFVFHYPHLRSIQLRWIVSDDFACAADCRVILHLRRRVEDANDVATATLAANHIRHNNFARFDFPPIQDSQNQAYYFFLDASQAAITRGTLGVWASGDDAYPDGQMFADARPSDADLAFRAYYAPDLPMILGALSRVLARYFSILTFALIVLILPGFLLFRWSDLSPAESIARTSGITLAILAAAPIFFAALGIPLNWVALLAPVALASLLVRSGDFNRPIGWLKPSLRTESFVFAFALFSLALGLLQIQDLPVPLWVDSPTHAAYINTLISEGRLPAQAYHLGYHGVVAFITQLAGVSIPQAMLIVGQIFITLSGLSVYVLSRRLTDSALGALASAVCVWFLSPMPAYLITWGRYPLLLGAMLLPIALVGAIDLLERPRLDARAFFFAALTCIGLASAQIRLVVFYAVFVAAFALAQRGRALSRLVIVALAGLAFIALWLTTLFANQIELDQILARNAGAVPIDLSVAYQVVFSHHGAIVGALAAIAALVAVWRRRRNMLIILAWFVALIVVSLLAGDYIAPSFVVLMGFLPASLLIGDLVARLEVSLRAERSNPQFGIGDCFVASFDSLRSLRIAPRNDTLSAFVRVNPRPIILVFLALVSLLGAREMLSIVNPTTILFTSADDQAMTWIRDHTPADAQFLINSFQWYGDYIVPVDGGAWIPYLTRRTASSLDVSPLTTSQNVDALNAWIAHHGITHIYLGRRAGLLNKGMFAGAPARFVQIYNQDGIAIFRVR